MSVRIREALLLGALRVAKAIDGRRDDLALLPASEPACVLLISSTALGDTVLSTAAFAPVRKLFPKSRIVALIHAAYLPLFRHCAEIDAVIPFHGGWRRFFATLRALRAEHPDLALILHGNEPQATPLAYLAGARFIVKLPNRNRFRFLLSNASPLLGWKDLGHGMQQRLAVAALAGAEIDGARMSLPAVPQAAARVDSFVAGHNLAGRRLVGFQCGASSRSRMWPAASFAELGRRLLDRFPDAGIVLSGAPAERSYLEGIAREIGAGAAVAAGAVPIECLPEMVGRLGVLVSGDTGTMHIAFALGVPTVCLFAVSDPATSGPPCDRQLHTVIHRPRPDPRITPKSQDQSLIAKIGVDEVFDAVVRTLERAAA